MGAARTGGRSFTNRASYFEPRIEYGGESRKLDHRLHLGRWQYPNSATAAVVTLPVKCVVVRGGLAGSLSSSGAPKGRRIAAGKIEVAPGRVDGEGRGRGEQGDRQRISTQRSISHCRAEAGCWFPLTQQIEIYSRDGRREVSSFALDISKVLGSEAKS